MAVKCNLCGDIVNDEVHLNIHMSKVHWMDFRDEKDMKRRLQAVGIDVTEVTERPKLTTLHG